MPTTPIAVSFEYAFNDKPVKRFVVYDENHNALSGRQWLPATMLFCIMARAYADAPWRRGPKRVPYRVRVSLSLRHQKSYLRYADVSSQFFLDA